MNNKISTDNLINQLPADIAQQLRKEVKEAVKKIKRGGKRSNTSSKIKTNEL